MAINLWIWAINGVPSDHYHHHYDSGQLIDYNGDVMHESIEVPKSIVGSSHNQKDQVENLQPKDEIDPKCTPIEDSYRQEEEGLIGEIDRWVVETHVIEGKVHEVFILAIMLG